jgi:hypothetical protein
MLPAEISLLRMNILSGVQQCFSVLLKQWSFGEEGSTEQKSTTCCTVISFQTLEDTYLAIQDVFYFVY